MVIPIDDFNNKPIIGDKIHVWIEGEKPAVRKQEGYHVFVNLRQKSFVLHLEGEFYHKQKIWLDEEKLKQYRQETLKVRMVPNRCYPISPNTTCVEGKARENCIIQIYSEENGNPYKLLYTYEKGSRQIGIYHYGDINIEGKTLLIKNKSDEQYEFVEIEGKREEENMVTYNIRYPLEHTYKKIGTILYPVYRIKTNSQGEFYFPIANISSSNVPFVFSIMGEKNRKEVIELTAGKVNKVELRNL